MSKPAKRMDSTPARKLSHDLSGPLTSILINCEMLLEQECSAEIRHRAQTILVEAMRMNQRLRESRVDEAA